MKLERITGYAALVLLALIGALLLLLLARKADHASALRRDAGAAASASAAAASAAWSQTLRFDRAAAPIELLPQGWSPPELGSGVWSSAPLATVRIPPSPAAGNPQVALAVEAFIAPTRPFQRVRVRAGGRTLGDWTLSRPDLTTLTFPAPAELRGAGGVLELQLELPDADAPARHVQGSTDARRLAIKLHEITVTG